MKTNFNELINDVETKILVLPDFQRKFVWDEEKMRRLYASVLCEMPIGSYLTLKSNDKQFSCKEIGAKPRSCSIDISGNEPVSYLIDGQQRITSLFAGFSTYFFRKFKNEKNNIASNDLIKIYFLKIPTISNANSDDLFNVRDLSFNYQIKKNNHIYFKSSDLENLIESDSVEKIFDIKKTELPDLTDENTLEKLEHYCIDPNNDFYKIPLQLFSGESDEINNCLRNILNHIASHYSDQLKNLSEKQRKNKQENWKDNLNTYLKSCLSNLDLNLIEVENSDKIRAIDIYSNLNQGGVALSVFDLVMAKVGSIYQGNYYDFLIEKIQKTYSYPQELLSDKVKGWIDTSGKKYDNTAKIANVVNKKNDIDNFYINIFLNVLSLYIHKIKNNSFSERYVKQDAILDLDAKDIFDNTEVVCEAIDRALFFFQTRCGIRKISDVNYKAQITLVAYVFMEEKYWKNKMIHDFLEYWYWLSLFANLYTSNQDVSILKETQRFTKYFDNLCDEKTPLEIFKEQHFADVLNQKFYSDKETLTMKRVAETEKYPPAKISNYICQFYMALGYDDFFDEKVKINFLYDDSLEMHHIMPLGNDPELKIGNSTKDLRGKKDNKYNSPLNMMYVTKKSNGMISDMKYQDYSKDERIKKILPLVGCPTNINDNDNIDDFLASRFDNFSAKLNERLNELYEKLEGKIFIYG